MKYILPPIILLLSLSATSVATEASERLHYRLSYSGLITGFFWKKLADVTLNLQPVVAHFHQQRACQLSMDVNTSAYTFAEMIHPVRYRWESTLSTNLQQTLLSRNIDVGASDIHEAAWYDWSNRAISLFRKRKQIDLNQDPFDDEAEPNLVWEKDKYQPAPPFIDAHPPIENGMGYLMQTGYFKKVLSESAIDPLAMIRRVRHHNFNQLGSLSMLIVLDEDIQRYQAQVKERQPLQVGDKQYPSTLKVEVRRVSESGQKGAIYFWLTDDSKRMPIRIDVDAPLGMIHLELQRTEDNLENTLCAPLRVVQGKNMPPSHPNK